MTPPSWMTGPPKKILLATDLSPRCDRALDRSAELAGEWQSALVVLHVIEDPDAGILDAGSLAPRRHAPDPASVARRHLLADVGAVAARATVLMGEGNPAEAILHVAETKRCDLIVTGIARDELFGRFSLGANVERLLRRARVPLLVVENRPRGAYRHIVVATDFSESSRHAVEAAARFFPDRPLTLFHAMDTSLSRLITDPSEYRKRAESACESFLESVDKPAGWSRPHVLIADGSPSLLLRDHVLGNDVDLVVAGTHGRSGIMRVFLGSVAKAILDEVPCDVLVVREPHAGVEG